MLQMQTGQSSTICCIDHRKGCYEVRCSYSKELSYMRALVQDAVCFVKRYCTHRMWNSMKHGGEWPALTRRDGDQSVLHEHYVHE